VRHVEDAGALAAALLRGGDYCSTITRRTTDVRKTRLNEVGSPEGKERLGSVPPEVLKSGSEVERLFDLSLDLFCIAGFDGFFKRVNPAFEQTLGYSSQELLSRPFLELVHPDDLQRSRDVLAAALRGNDVIGFDNRVVCADGSVRWLEWNTRTIPDEGFVYGVARDVTDRRRAEAELREAHHLVETSRDELRVLADEQAALRRVATLVAKGVQPDEVFAAVAEEVAASSAPLPA
jgi:PAS domain S-box-containing protein